MPNLNSSKWGDRAWLNINHRATAIINEEAQESEGVVSISAGGLTHRYFVDMAGRVEYEIVFESDRVSDTIVLDLDFPPGLSFYYQPPLTPAEIEAGDFRPDEVVGSYAVYWREKNGVFQTGKFCHIYRPKLVDAAGVERWAEQNIDPMTKKWTIAIDLSGLTFPVTLDPTVGYTSEGGTVHQPDPWTASGPYTPSSDGEITAFKIWAYSTASRTYWAGVYSDNGGVPDALLADSPCSVPVPDCDPVLQVCSFNYVTLPLLTKNQPIWVALNNNTSRTRSCYDTNGDYDAKVDNLQTYPPPDNFTVNSTLSNRIYSWWLEYTATGGDEPDPSGREHFQTRRKAVNMETADRGYRRQTKKRIYRFQSKES